MFGNLHSLEILTFTSPGLAAAQADPWAIGVSGGVISAYVPLHLTILPFPASSPSTIDYNSMVYYSADQCILVGQWKSDGQGGCLMCPKVRAHSDTRPE